MSHRYRSVVVKQIRHHYSFNSLFSALSSQTCPFLRRFVLLLHRWHLLWILSLRLLVLIIYLRRWVLILLPTFPICFARCLISLIIRLIGWLLRWLIGLLRRSIVGLLCPHPI